MTLKETYLTYQGSRRLPFVSIIVPARNEQDNIERLNKGELVMIHSAFRHPIKISFPKGAFGRLK
jgi:hypothetical protein